MAGDAPSPPTASDLNPRRAVRSITSTMNRAVKKLQRLNAKLFLAKKLLFVLLLFALDIRDVVYKVAWIGPTDTYSFITGSTGVLHAAPLISTVTIEGRALDAGEHVASGWSSFLSRCEELHAISTKGGSFFLSAVGRNCSVRVAGNKTRVIPQLVMTSSIRADAPVWASCLFLHFARRPPMCQDHIATHFNQRYGFWGTKIYNNDVAPIGSDAEAEILHFLDLLSTSVPLHRVVCVEALELAEGATGTFTADLFGCASPNLFRSEFIGLEARQYTRLLHGKAWLTIDRISLMGLEFKAQSNFSSYGTLYALMVAIDLWLLQTHCRSAFEIIKWMFFPKYRALQLWARQFETSLDSRMIVPEHLVQQQQQQQHQQQQRKKHRGREERHGGSGNGNRGSCGAETNPIEFREERFYAFFSASYYKSPSYVWLVRLTRVISWAIIQPNSVVWTWSDSQNEKMQAFLSSIKVWVLISGAIQALWHLAVRTSEARAYRFVRGTYITSLEIIVIGALAAAALQDDIFLLCEKKWAIENQRVNDVVSFRGGYVAHANTFQRENDYRTTTPTEIFRIMYAPLVNIVLLSIVLAAVWLLVSDHEPYARLPLEDALNIPIRAHSLVRNGLSMEIVRDGKRYIRPSCYLDYGIMLKHGAARTQTDFTEIFRNDRLVSVNSNISAAPTQSVRPPSTTHSFQAATALDKILAETESIDCEAFGGGRRSAADTLEDEAGAAASELRALSRVNAGVRRIDELTRDDGTDDAVEQLNLHGNFLERMDGLEAFSGLVELCLSNNSIQEIAFNALEQLVHLRILDLSANSISSTRGFPQLPRLEELSLAHNCLRRLDGLTRPIKFPKLRYLDLRHNDIGEYNSIVALQHHKRLTQLRLQAHDGSQINPMCELDDYPQPVLKMLPRLVYLDEEEVSLLREVGSLYMPRDATTNTEMDFEKELLRREQDTARREQECLAREKELLAQESACFAREKALVAQVIKLQEELSAAVARVANAETAAVESADQLRLHAASAAAAERRLQEQSKQLAGLESQIVELNESHRRELEQFKTVEGNLVRTIDIARDESRELRRLAQENESEARAKEAAVTRAEAKANELARSLERAAAEHSATAQRLASDVQAYTDRLEHSEKRSAQLEAQAKELQANVEAAYNKCAEKDDEIRRLKRALLTKSDDMEDMKAQHAKATGRLEQMAQQQGELFRQRLETSVAQLEMEFRREHYQSMSKLQLVQKKNQDAARESARLKDACRFSAQREADAQHELAKLRALLADDQRKVVADDAQRADAYRVSLDALTAEIAAVKSQLEAARAKSAMVVTLEATAEELRAANDRLRADVARRTDEVDALKVLESDLRAAVKVKDVIIEHGHAQLASLRAERDAVEQQLQDEIAELQCQVDDLELALDESIEKEAGREKKLERALAQLDEKDRALLVKAQEIDDLAHELDTKHGALELIETEMERLRAALDDQNGLFQRRLERHLEQHREELERAKAGAEEARELLRIQWEAERRELMQRYAAVAGDLKDVAAQNAKLRVSVEAERKRNEQSDQEMRVLLAQIDRERHLKKESLKHIKSLFEQLQQESP
ncbi:hypothetical protein PybrP1_004231 [[Pythium] brassicae (nom. inval.)]|nr:hypothetical protein PybrP1_004231 [[Pythium] brassicae (nom. inval.)]